MHSHDVRALAIWPPYTPLPHSFRRHFPKDVAPILASGGLDMSVVVTPAALPTSTIVKITNPLTTSTESTFEDAYHRRLAYSVGGVMKVARQARLVTCARDAGLTVWRIQKKPDGVGTEEEAAREDIEAASFEGGWEKVLEMELNVNSNLVAHQISDDGKWLVISDIYETKLFVLDQDVSMVSLVSLNDPKKSSGQRSS
jgi:U3 small nucleolar RNA-associated protein 4